MYFDDISRHGVEWNWNPHNEWTSSSSSQYQQPQPPMDERELIQRLLTGYDAETAIQLSSREGTLFLKRRS